MRGKGLSELAHTKKARITPACAGKTTSVLPSTLPATDHPRVCGENAVEGRFFVKTAGSPPRVRGKHYLLRSAYRLPRITPACAGKTGHGRAKSVRHADHPRACGENQAKRSKSKQKLGSPPRMRGKQGADGSGAGAGRITPAHAGKTTSVPLNNPLWTDHPRACGENASIVLYFATLVGSPPRMRGKRIRYSTSRAMRRITPAHAGKTTPSRTRMAAISDHPRVCGENFPERQKSHSRRGSPPRVRGKHIVFNSANHLVGITPACAGKTSDFQQCIF